MEFPEVPPVGRLNKLRTRLLPPADGIIALAKGAHIEDGVVAFADSKQVAQRRRELDKRLGALGVPQRSARLKDFPPGTREAAASGEFFVALESACSAIVGVCDAEESAIRARRSGQVGAPKWSFGRNYNTFIREARSEYDLTLAEARIFYREVRDWKVGPAYGADVARYKDALYDDPQLVVDSMLYGAPGVVGPVYEAGDYPDDFMLGEGAEIELTAETYSEADA